MTLSQSAEKKPSRPRGTGSVYQRGPIWWIKYSRNGRAFCESTHTTNRRRAEKILNRRLGELISGTFLPPAVERIKVQELVEDTFRDYRLNHRKSLDDAEARWRMHLAPFFAHIRAADLCRTDAIERYIDQRQKEGASNGTINREMSLLKRAFHLGRAGNAKKVREIPVFPHLKEADARRGFLEDNAYRRLVEGEPLWFRAVVEVARKFAWRLSEVLNLRVSQVDLFARTIRLHAGETKNNDARTVLIPDGLYVLLVECVTGKGSDDRVFTRRNGTPVRDFRWTWWKACTRAGVGRIFCPQCDLPLESKRCPKCRHRAAYDGLLFHDLRRTGARNLRRAGVAEGVIMKIGGWRTRSVFERYNIVDEADLKDAMRKVEAHEQQLAAVDGQATGERLQYGYNGQQSARKQVRIEKGQAVQ